MISTYISQVIHDLFDPLPTVWQRSENMVAIPLEDSEQHYVVYSRLLNSPYIVGAEEYEYINNNKYIDLSSETDNDEFIAELINNFTYIPKSLTEDYFISHGIETHMADISAGKYTSLLDLRISTACNFGCEHCIAATSKTNEHMSIEQTKSLIDTYVDFIQKGGGNHLDIHYGIAEPFLDFDVIEASVKYVIDNYSDFTYEFSINTNLSLLTDEQIAFVKNNNIHLHVSIDGLGETNDLIRVFRDGSGTFDTINGNIQRLRTAGYPISDIGVTLTERNYYRFVDEVDEFIAWCVENGITEIACEFDLINSDNITTDEKIRFLIGLIDEMAKHGISFDGTWSIPYRNLLNATYAERAYSFCRGGSGINISAGCDRKVYLCSCSCKPICSIDDLQSELQPNGAFFSFVRDNLIDRQAECMECPIIGCCVGQCKVTREYHKVFDEKIKSQCEFFTKMTHALLKRDSIDLLKDEAQQ